MSTRKVALTSLLIVIIMFGFSFAIAPLYNKFCRASGFTTFYSEKDFNQKENLARNITIQFVATNNEKLNWEFYPRVTSIAVHPNQKTEIYFHVKNTSKHLMIVQAIPSYAPLNASRYFHKLECFCFRQQTLQADETKEMPVVFRIDENLPKEIHTITLAYTLFDVTRKTS